MLETLGFRKQGLPKEVNFPLTLAPMVGLSHCAFRQVLREYLPQGAQTLWPSEMLNSRRIPDEKLHTIPEAMLMGDESFWIPQILANEENKIQKSVIKLFENGAQWIDINMGCPVRKALKHNYGVSLMGDADYAARVVEMTVRCTQGPVSVKLRGVEQENKDQWKVFVKGLESAGAHWLCLHPRTASQKRRGYADWNQIQELTQIVSIPVIGNGDIQTKEDVVSMLTDTQCDMVMVGRALTARPWLLWQVGELLGFPPPEGRSGKAPATPEEEGAEYGRSLIRLFELMEEKFSERLALRKFNFHVKTSSVWLPFGHSLYAKVTGAKTGLEIKKVLESFFQSPQSMSQKTFLRQ